MFLIQCAEDKSLCIVKNSHVICDDKLVKIGDTVLFYWKSKSYNGTILKQSEDHDLLSMELKKIHLREKAAAKKTSSTSNSVILGNQQSRRTRSFSPSKQIDNTDQVDSSKVKKERSSNKKKTIKRSHKISPPKKSKKYKTSKQVLSESSVSSVDVSDESVSKENQNNSVSPSDKNSSSDESSKSAEKSPTKEELKAMLENYQRLSKENNENQNVDSVNASKNNALSHDKDDADNQLFGHDYVGEEMVHLQDGVYCKRKIYNLALGTSHQATHVARKLLEGVFKHECLIKSTLSGQAPRAQGKARQAEEVISLNERARVAITEFSQSIATRNNWSKQDDKKIKIALGQKLVELKRTAAKNKS